MGLRHVILWTVRRPAMAPGPRFPCRIVASRAGRRRVCRAPSLWCRDCSDGCLRFVTGAATRRWRKTMTVRTRLLRQVRDRRQRRWCQPRRRRPTCLCARTRLPMRAGHGRPSCPPHPVPRWSFTQALSRHLPNGHPLPVYRFPRHRFRRHATRQAGVMHLFTSAPARRRAKHIHRFVRRSQRPTP